MEDNINQDSTKRAIEEVYDKKEGIFINSKEFFSRPEAQIMAFRKHLEEAILLNKPRFVCSHCGQMVKLSGRATNKGQVSFFSHLYDSDDCDIKTTTKMSKEEIEAKKYGMVGESQRHKYLKECISSFLQTETSINDGVSDVAISKRIKSEIPYLNWRCPDVVAKYKGKTLVFELQLSNTFLSVIVDRDIFYRLHNYYVIWVFNFDNEQNQLGLGNLLAKDIYYANKRNVFILDKDAIKKSKEENKLYLSVTWLDLNNKFVEKKLVSLDELSFDENSCKPFYFDADEQYYQNHPEELKRVSDLERSREDVLNALMLKQKKEEEKARQIAEAQNRKRNEMRQTGGIAAPYEKGKKQGYEYQGTKLTQPIYTFASPINNQGYGFVIRNRKHGLVNRYAEEIIPCCCKLICPLPNQTFLVAKDNYWKIWQNEKEIVKIKKGDNTNFKSINDIFSVVTILREKESIVIIVRNDGAFKYVDNVGDFNGEIVEVTLMGHWTSPESWYSYGYWHYKKKEYIPGETCLLTHNGYFIRSNVDMSKGVFPAETFTGEKGLLNREFQAISTFDWSSINLVNDTIAIVRKNAHDGLIVFDNTQGKFNERIPCKYDSLELLADDKFGVCLNNSWGVVDISDNIIIPIQYDYIKGYQNGLYSVSRDYRLGVCDHTGKEIVEDQRPFAQNLVIGKFFEKYGLVDNNGNLVLNYEYDIIELINNKFIKADQKLFTLSGELLYPNVTDIKPLNEELIKVCINYRWGVIDSLYNTIIPIHYQLIGDVSNGLIAVKKDSRWGLCDFTGKEIVEDVKPFGDNLLIGRFFEKYGLTDNNGNLIINYKYDNIEFINNICIKADLDLFTLNGDLLHSDIVEAQQLENGIVICKSYYQFFLYDSSLNPLLKEYRIKQISDFQDGRAEILLDNGKTGIISNQGEIYDESVEPLANGKTKNKIFGYWGIKDQNNEWIFPALYNSIIELESIIILNTENSFSIVDVNCNLIKTVNGMCFESQINEDLLKVSSSSHYGLCDLEGRIIQECKYAEIKNTSSGFLFTKRIAGRYSDYEFYGLLKPDGETAIDCDNREVQIISGKFIHVINRGQHLIYDFELNKLCEFYKTKKLNSEYRIVSNERLNYAGNNHWGVVDSSWESIIPCNYNEIRMLSDSWFALKQKGKWGCISTDLSEKYPCIYPNICLNNDSQPSVRIKKRMILCSDYVERPPLVVNNVYNGRILEIRDYGIMIKVESFKCLLHISKIRQQGKSIKDFSVGESIEVRVASFDESKNRYSLCL